MLKRNIPIILGIILTLLCITGCAGLLPSTAADIKSPWKNYTEAKEAFDKIIPGKTTVKDLKELSIDPFSNPNIWIMNANDVAKKYLINESVKIENLDPGIQTCLANRDRCQGFFIMAEKINTKHILDSQWGFFLDWFGFVRNIRETGWRCEKFFLILDGIVIYAERDGGRPFIDQGRLEKKPLGPLQDADKIIDVGKKIWLQ